MKHRKKKANKDMREDFLVSELVDVSIRNYELKQNLKHVEVYQHSLENQIASINLSKAYALWQKVLEGGNICKVAYFYCSLIF